MSRAATHGTHKASMAKDRATSFPSAPTFLAALPSLHTCLPTITTHATNHLVVNKHTPRTHPQMSTQWAIMTRMTKACCW